MLCDALDCRYLYFFGFSIYEERREERLGLLRGMAKVLAIWPSLQALVPEAERPPGDEEAEAARERPGAPAERRVHGHVWVRCRGGLGVPSLLPILGGQASPAVGRCLR